MHGQSIAGTCSTMKLCGGFYHERVEWNNYFETTPRIHEILANRTWQLIRTVLFEGKSTLAPYNYQVEKKLEPNNAIAIAIAIAVIRTPSFGCGLEYF
jgi:hypothetical protein